MDCLPALTAERVGQRLKRLCEPTTRAVLAALLASTAACSSAEVVAPTSSVQHETPQNILQPNRVGQLVLMFAEARDTRPLSHLMRSAMPKIMRRAVDAYGEATLGNFPNKFPVKIIPSTLPLSVSVKDRCDSEAKNDLATDIIAQSQEAAAERGYRLRPDDFTVVVLNSAKPCRNSAWGGEVAGVGDNDARSAIIYDGNDPYTTVESVLHELGHSVFAAGDSTSIECPSPQTPRQPEECAVVDYGDLHTVMGNGSYLDHDLLDGWEMMRLGYIKPSQVRTLATPGKYTVRLNALLNPGMGQKLIKIPISNVGLNFGSRADNYLLELSGDYIDSDMLGCANAVQCLSKTRIPQGVSMKVYAVAATKAVQKYQGAYNFALHRQGLEVQETGATQRRDAGKIIFNDVGLQVRLGGIRKGRTPATGSAILQVCIKSRCDK